MQKAGRTSDRAKLYYAAGALIFLLVIKLLVFLDGKVLVWLYDGASQYLSSLTYYSEYLKEIISGIFHGNLSIPSWDLSIGEGSDIISTFHYYCIGDPFAFLCVFFPKELMYLCYEFTVLLRVFLSGFSFMFFVNKYDGGKLREKASDIQVALGAMLYAFSCWTLMVMGRHSFFLNPTVFLPLILAGAELIISRKKPGVMMFAVCITSLSNLYFFYMVAMITVVYVAVRIILLYGRRIKEMLTTLALIAAEAVIGVLLSGILFLPVAKVFISDSRISNGSNIGLFYRSEYYSTLPKALITGDWSYYRLFGLGAIGIIIIYLICVRSRSKLLKIFLALSVLFLVFPVFGAVFNGFAYSSNRWCFAFPLITGIGLIVVWDDLLALRKADAVILSVAVAASCIYMTVIKDIKGIVITALGLAIIAACLFIKNRADKAKVASFLIVISLLSGIVIYFIPYMVQLSPPDWLNLYYYGSEASYIAAGDDTRPVRYSGNILTENTSPLAGISSTQFYWSNANSYVGEFRTDIASDEYRLYYYTGYDSSYILLNLSGCRYYALAGRRTDALPYGYEVIDHMDIGYDIMKSSINTGLVYSYDKAVGKDEWDRMTPVDRQMLISEYLVLSDSASTGMKADTASTEVNASLTKEDGGVTVAEFEGKPGSETYVTISNIRTELVDEFIYFFVYLPETDETFAMDYYTQSNWYNGRDEFVINLGWHDKPLHKAVITIRDNPPCTCDYKISCIDVEKAGEDLRERFDHAPQKIDVEGRGSVISFDVNSRGEYYVLAVPYAKGWKAYVDGKETEVIRANIQYMAVNVPEGDHNVRFAYTGDTGKGAVMSLAGIICAAAYLICVKIRLKSKSKE